MYDPSPKSSTLFQGDVLRSVVVVHPPEAIMLVRDENGEVRIVPSDQAEDAFPEGRDAIVAAATMTDVAIISQTCDINSKPFVTVAAVKPTSELNGWSEKAHLHALTLKSWFQYFPLEASGNFQASVIDFTQTFSLTRETVSSHMSRRILSLDPRHRVLLQHKLEFFFARPERETDFAEAFVITSVVSA